jgi:L-ascorbate metabolism protein UlaG (beta-lactamase superfamily)
VRSSHEKEEEPMPLGKTLEITWYGQAMFSIAGAGTTVVVDPTPPETGYSYDPVDADIVLVTHTHFDHNFTAGVAGSPKVINASGKFDLGGIEVRGIDSFHDSAGGAERGNNVIYTWEQAGMRLAHFGDLGHMLKPEAVKRLLKLDVAMIPVGGVFTIDAEQATRLIRDLEPSIVLPMHYGTADGKVPVEPVDEFARRFSGGVRTVETRSAVVTPDEVPVSTQVWILPYK